MEKGKLFRASRLRGSIVMLGIIIGFIAVVFWWLGKWPNVDTFIIVLIFLPLHFLIMGSCYDVVVGETYVTGRDGQSLIIRRATISRDNIDVVRSGEENLFDKFLRRQSIWSKDGKKILIEGMVHKRKQRKAIFQELGIAEDGDT